MTKLEAHIPPAAAAKPLSPTELLASLRNALTPWTPGTPFWIFAYGSLMWNPSFTFDVRHVATIRGYHRSFRVWSRINRGTPDKPGLVLTLERGGSCRGLAHRLPARDYDAVRRYLWRREIENDGVYVEESRPIHLADGRTVRSLVYLADRAHRQFAGKLPLVKALRLVRQGKGATGTNIEYVRNTIAHLRELGLRDKGLEELALRADS